MVAQLLTYEAQKGLDDSPRGPGRPQHVYKDYRTVVSMKSCTIRTWSSLALEAHEAKQVYFTQHRTSAGSCLISIWLGAMLPTAPRWPCKLETSTSGKGTPTSRFFFLRPSLQASGTHQNPDF